MLILPDCPFRATHPQGNSNDRNDDSGNKVMSSGILMILNFGTITGRTDEPSPTIAKSQPALSIQYWLMIFGGKLWSPSARIIALPLLLK